MNKFIVDYILQPIAGKWIKGFSMLLLWTVAFIALPAISGWFLASCSLAFMLSNRAFAYLIPSATIRLLTLFRTATRYFERLENHKNTLNSQQKLQLKVFESVARFSYFKKQVNKNSAILENSTYGIDQVLNHILLWLLPFASLIISLTIYVVFLGLFSHVIAVEFLVSSAILLFIVPQLIFRKNRILYQDLKTQREDNNQAFIESFRGRIEISKYGLEEKAIGQYELRLEKSERLEKKLQTNSFYLQLIAGLGFSFIALFLLWSASHNGISAEMAIGIFFGVMAQAELAEMLFSGKSEKSSVAHQIRDLKAIFEEGEVGIAAPEVDSRLQVLSVRSLSAKIPETNVTTSPISFNIEKGKWIALFGETGKGKTTLLNSLFYPEFRRSGSLRWNDDTELPSLPVPECIYVTQKAYLLTGTLRENFEGYSDAEIEEALQTVDLTSWFVSLPNGLDSWLGENGETLSGGQRKKLLLAQALLTKPQLLVVDEPTAGISSENAIAIFQTIKRLYPDTAILMATHLTDFESVADESIRT